MNGKELEELFLPLIGEQGFQTKLAAISYFSPNTICYHINDKRKINAATANYYMLLAKSLIDHGQHVIGRRVD